MFHFARSEDDDITTSFQIIEGFLFLQLFPAHSSKPSLGGLCRAAFAMRHVGVLLIRLCAACHGKALGTTGVFSGRKSAETGFVQQRKQLAISWPARSFHRSGTQEIMPYSYVKFIFLQLLSINSLSYCIAMRQEGEEAKGEGETEETFWFSSEI